MRLHLAVLAVLLILIAGCTAPPQGGANAPANATPSGGATAPSGGTPSGGATASVSKCVTDCAVLTDSGMIDMCRMGCYTDAAEKTKDASNCDPISTMKNASIFYSSCLGNVAGLNSDISPCRKLTNSSEKDWCINIAADKYKNPAICDEVTDTTMKAVCLDTTNQTK